MKSWREKTSELIRWEMKGVPILYPVAFIIFLIPILFWNIKNILFFDAFTIDDTSAKYLLSALVQSLAAIIAIVITLTLVAVQLTASAYSPRVIDVFKKDKAMWWLLVWYGSSIFFGLFVLEMMGGEYQNLSRGGVPLELCVFLAYLMGIAAFIGLFWNIGNMIYILKPKNIIYRLSEDITKDNVLKHIKSVEGNRKDRTTSIEEDSVQPIMDIICGSVVKYDLETTRVGLSVVTERIIEIVDSDIHLDDKKEVSRCFCDHFKRVGRLAVIKTDEEATAEIIKNLYSFCEIIVEKKLDDAAKQAVESLGLVGRISAENRFEDAVKLVALHLGLVGRVAAEKELEEAVKQVIESLGLVGRVAAENGLEDAAWQTVPRLELIGKAAAEQEFDDVVEQAASHLGRIGGVAAVNRFERVAKEAAKSLGSIGKVAIGEELVERSVAIQAIESLGLVGDVAAKQRLKNATLEAATHLGLIGKAAAEKGLKFGFAAEQAIEYLRRVGEIAAKQGLKTTISQVALRFISIGSVAIDTEKELEFAANRAAEYLAELTISNKEIVENQIKFSGYAFEEKDRKSFDRFVNLYKQYLEESRTHKYGDAAH